MTKKNYVTLHKYDKNTRIYVVFYDFYVILTHILHFFMSMFSSMGQHDVDIYICNIIY